MSHAILELLTNAECRRLERRMRRRLRDMGCTLKKSPARSEAEDGYGQYMIFGSDGPMAAPGPGRCMYSLHLADVAEYISC